MACCEVPGHHSARRSFSEKVEFLPRAAIWALPSGKSAPGKNQPQILDKVVLDLSHSKGPPAMGSGILMA